LNDLAANESGNQGGASIASFAVSNSVGPLTEVTIDIDGLAGYLKEKQS